MAAVQTLCGENRALCSERGLCLEYHRKDVMLQGVQGECSKLTVRVKEERWRPSSRDYHVRAIIDCDSGTLLERERYLRGMSKGVARVTLSRTRNITAILQCQFLSLKGAFSGVVSRTIPKGCCEVGLFSKTVSRKACWTDGHRDKIEVARGFATSVIDLCEWYTRLIWRDVSIVSCLDWRDCDLRLF